MELAIVSAYLLPDGAKIEIAKQRDGRLLWAVRQDGNCLSIDGEWEYEPMPSSRDDDFINRCRFASAEDAYHAWMKRGDN